MDLQQDRLASIKVLKHLERQYCDALEGLPRKRGMRKSEKAMTATLYRERITAFRVAVRTINRTLEAENGPAPEPQLIEAAKPDNLTMSIFGQCEALAAEDFIKAGRATRIAADLIPDSVKFDGLGRTARFAIAISKEDEADFEKLIADYRL